MKVGELARPEHLPVPIWLMVPAQIAWLEPKVPGLDTGLMAAFVILTLARLRRIRRRSDVWTWGSSRPDGRAGKLQHLARALNRCAIGR